MFEIPEVERRENGAGVIFEEIKFENFSKLLKPSGHRFKPKQVKCKETHSWIHQSKTAENQTQDKSLKKTEKKI